MSENPSRKLFYVELALFVGLFTAATFLLFPKSWEPMLALVIDREEVDDDSSRPAVESLSAFSPQNKSVRIQAKPNRGIGEFRTSLDRSYESAENQFEPRSNDPQIGLAGEWGGSDFSVGSLQQQEVSFSQDDVPPPPPGDEWEIQEMVEPLELSSPIDVPEILPGEHSSDVFGQIEPLLDIDKAGDFLGGEFRTLPAMPGDSNDKSNPAYIPTDPTWWIGEIQQPQFADRQPLPVNLDNVVLMALQRAPELQVLNTEPEVQRTLIDQNIAAFDWGTFLNTAWNDTNIPVNNLLQTGSLLFGGAADERFLETELAVEGGVTKRLATGGDIRVGQTFGRLDNNSLFLSPDDQGISRLVIDYRQPLFRGAGKRYTQRQIVLARLDFEQIQNQSTQRIQEYLVEVVAAYWQLYQARAVLVQTRRSYDRATDLLVRLRNRAGIDVTNDQILRAEAAASSRKSDAIRAEYEVRNAQDILVNLTVGPDSQETNFLELIPEPMVLPEYVPNDLETLAYVALRNRPEIGEAIARIKTGETLEYIAVNELLPQLDAILSTSLNGLRGDFDAFGAFSDQFRRGDPSYSVGFEFALPVGNRAAKSAVQRQQLQTKIFTQQFEKSVGDVVLDVRIAARNLERLNSEMQNNFGALQKSAQELEQIRTRQELLLDEGKTASFYVENLLASQARLTQAEGRLLTSQTEHAIALIDLKRATGELLNAKCHVDQFQPMDVEFVNHVQSIAGQLPSNLGAIPTVIESGPAQVIPATQPGSVNLLPEIVPIAPSPKKEYFAPVFVQPDSDVK